MTLLFQQKHRYRGFRSVHCRCGTGTKCRSGVACLCFAEKKEKEVQNGRRTGTLSMKLSMVFEPEL